MEMSRRERVLTAMNRKKPDRVPKECSFTPALYEIFVEKTGHTNPAEYFGFETTHVGFKGSEEPLPDWSEWYPEGIPANASITEYGGMHIPGDFYHFHRYDYPMKNVDSLKRMEEFPWPDYHPAVRHDHLEEQVRQLHEQDWYVLGGVGHIWETAWQITSMEKMMMDFVMNPELADYVLTRVTENQVIKARRFAEAGCDCLHCGDDVGMQHKLMMHPDMWRQWLKPRWAQVWAAAREINPDIQIFYHSDGNIDDIIEDLIEIGMTILNPVQPECVDPAEMKRKYGDRVAFWGCVGTQTTFPFGTPDEMKRTIRHLVETVGNGGGLLLAPTHVLEPDVPWENVEAFFEAVNEYGRYS